MGLLTGYQEDADRLARQEKNLTRGYNHDIRGIMAQAAPHEAVVKDYNTQVEGFKNSAVMRGSDGELWEIIGFLAGTSAPMVNQPVNYPGGYVVPGAPDASKVESPAPGSYAGSGVNQQGMHGYYSWQNTPDITLRGSGGDPIGTWQGAADNSTPVQAYASWNDRPFVAPVTAEQRNAATAASDKIGELSDQSAAITDQINKKAAVLSTKADRITDDISMNAGQLREEQQPQQSNSVFDQNMAGIHQTIADWLK